MPIKLRIFRLCSLVGRCLNSKLTSRTRGARAAGKNRPLGGGIAPSPTRVLVLIPHAQGGSNPPR
jgi:hypothetical protein